jgi:Tol biopolymer transport system component
MTSDYWARVKEIFAEALDTQVGARETFVREACRDDDALLQDVLKLLEGHSRANGTLSQPLFPLALGEQAEQPPRFSPSQLVNGRFRIIRLIARGGMGDVYEAEDLQLGVSVALKTIRPDIAADERVLELFKNEIQSARRVTHPNVCRIYDIAQHSEPVAGKSDEVTIFFTMELLAGETLSRHLKEKGPFSRDEALPLIRQLAGALQAAHEAGVIHRDFKPGNVILTSSPAGEPRPVVTDFGLAVPRTLKGGKPLPGAAGGTPAYMAPEQSNGGEVTTATDVYALGLVIAEIIGAKRPGGVRRPAGASGEATLSSPAASRSRENLQLPSTCRSWEQELLRCLEFDPAERHSRPMAVAEALAGKNPRHHLWTRHRVVTIASGVLLAVLSLTALFAQRFSLWRPLNPTTFRKLGPVEDTVELLNVSPDGRYFALVDLLTGNLGLRDIGRGVTRQLTNRAKSPQQAQALSAVFSPDGNRIAYSWVQDEVAELRIIDTTTGQDLLLVSDPKVRFYWADDWSRNGRELLSHLQWRDASNQIEVVSIPDSTVTFPLPRGPSSNIGFTPDGGHIVFSATQGTREFESDVFEVSIYGGPVTTLVKNPADDNLIGFSPDGGKLIFSSDREGALGIWAVDFTGDSTQGEPVPLAHNLGRPNWLGLARDGTLYYTIATDSFDVYSAEIDVAKGTLVSRPEKVVKRFRGSFRFPSWSANGNRLSFVSSLAGMDQIWIYYRETGELHQLPLQLAAFRRPQWDPSGDRIFVEGSDGNGHAGIFRVDTNTGEAKIAIDGAALNGNLGAWARDGQTIYDRFADGTGGLFRMNITTLQRKSLFVPPPGVNLGLEYSENLTLSPDERTLAFQARQPAAGTSALMLVPTSGGPARPLLTIKQPEAFLFGSFAWTADSRQVLAVRTRSMDSELWLVPVDGGSPKKIDFPNMRIVQLRMNPDGKTIAFTSGEASGEVWVAENLLPSN